MVKCPILYRSYIYPIINYKYRVLCYASYTWVWYSSFYRNIAQTMLKRRILHEKDPSHTGFIRGTIPRISYEKERLQTCLTFLQPVSTVDLINSHQETVFYRIDNTWTNVSMYTKLLSRPSRLRSPTGHFYSYDWIEWFPGCFPAPTRSWFSLVKVIVLWRLDFEW
jgi:hypothetical protein